MGDKYPTSRELWDGIPKRLRPDRDFQLWRGLYGFTEQGLEVYDKELWRAIKDKIECGLLTDLKDKYDNAPNKRAVAVVKLPLKEQHELIDLLAMDPNLADGTRYVLTRLARA